MEKNLKNLTFLIIIPAIIYGVFFFTTSYQYKNEKINNETIIKKQDLDLINFIKSREEKRLEAVFSDLVLVSNLPVMKEFLTTGSDEDKKRLKELFYEFSLSRKIYDQVRFLDSNGKEIVRANYSNGVTTIVDDPLLQNKKDRYYFKDPFSLGIGDIYVSVLDLNIENGEIEIPYKPMLRIATPLFEGGVKKGILIFNYLAQDILNNIGSGVLKNQIEEPIKSELLNDQGYWLKSNDPNEEWGFMFSDKKDLTLANKNPTLWEFIREKSEGQVMLSDGLHTFSTITPIKGQNIKWKVYHFTSKDFIYQQSKSIKNDLTILNTIVFMILMFSTLFISRIMKKIASTNKKFKYLFDYSHDAIMTLTPPEWKFSLGNSATLEIFGLKNDGELRRINLGDISPEYQPDGMLSSQKAKEMINITMKEGFNSFEWVHRKINGSEFLAEVTLVRIGDGNNASIQATVRDVTEKKKALELVKKSEEETKKALEESERMNKVMVGRES